MRWTMEWAICGSTELEADSEEDARRQFAEYHILDLALGGELDAHTCFCDERDMLEKTNKLMKTAKEMLDGVNASISKE